MEAKRTLSASKPRRTQRCHMTLPKSIAAHRIGCVGTMVAYENRQVNKRRPLPAIDPHARTGHRSGMLIRGDLVGQETARDRVVTWRRFSRMLLSSLSEVRLWVVS